VPFRDESEQLREQLRRAEESVAELEEQRAQLRAAAEADRDELTSLRRRDMGLRLGRALVLVSIGVGLGFVPLLLYTRRSLSSAAVLTDQLLRAERARGAESAAKHAALAEAKEVELALCRAEIERRRAAGEVRNAKGCAPDDPLCSSAAVSVHVTTTKRDPAAIAKMRADFARCIAPSATSQGGIAGGGTELSESERKCITDAAARAKAAAAPKGPPAPETR
jgi:hypothetical protein